jgi:hypothetical protein
MSYSLLEMDDYEGLPSEPHRKFAALEQITRRRMNQLMDQTESGQLATELRTQYQTLMITAARALGIPGISWSEGEFRNEWDEYQSFMISVQGAVAKIMLNHELVGTTRSVRLATSTKAKIEGQLRILRSFVEESDMPSRRRERLVSQLDEFGAELSRPRLDYSAVALVATALLASVQGVTSTLADAPNAYQTVGTILKWIGQDKDAEDSERERLGAPTPSLPSPTPKPKPTTASFGGFGDDLDDDVPF